MQSFQPTTTIGRSVPTQVQATTPAIHEGSQHNHERKVRDTSQYTRQEQGRAGSSGPASYQGKAFVMHALAQEQWEKWLSHEQEEEEKEGGGRRR